MGIGEGRRRTPSEFKNHKSSKSCSLARSAINRLLTDWQQWQLNAAGKNTGTVAPHSVSAAVAFCFGCSFAVERSVEVTEGIRQFRARC